MGRGDPDFHTPPHIVDAAKRAIDNNEHHYTHARWAAETARGDRGARCSREIRARLLGSREVVVTAGTQEARDAVHARALSTKATKC